MNAANVYAKGKADGAANITVTNKGKQIRPTTSGSISVSVTNGKTYVFLADAVHNSTMVTGGGSILWSDIAYVSSSEMILGGSYSLYAHIYIVKATSTSITLYLPSFYSWAQIN